MAVSVARLRELIALAAARGVERLDIVEDGTTISITRSGDAPAVLAASPADAAPVAAGVAVDQFPAPMFGVFHITSAPGARPFVAVGDRVAKGQQLCLIEAMKMFNAVTSDRDGTIAAVLAEPGMDVARGQPLFRIIAG